ncbi:hypothetical protein CEXT_132581 [Caerostris extrusa]|uniref:Uncharacterized protein n=1 Tax=Caerostris extrusa TaxID=172846 RepID=A0AAV4Y106_CAEEX|nr:hypothetical protein CEXT_132581 [Caerostris extrusa]
MNREREKPVLKQKDHQKVRIVEIEIDGGNGKLSRFRPEEKSFSVTCGEKPTTSDCRKCTEIAVLYWRSSASVFKITLGGGGGGGHFLVSDDWKLLIEGNCFRS